MWKGVSGDARAFIDKERVGDYDITPLGSLG